MIRIFMNLQEILSLLYELTNWPCDYVWATPPKWSSLQLFTFKSKSKAFLSLKNHGVCCSGLLNWIRGLYQLKLPNSYSLGGTKDWWNYAIEKNILKPYNKNNLQEGDVIIRNFREMNVDEGHIAFVYKIEESTIWIIHSYDSYRRKLIKPAKSCFHGVFITNLETSHKVCPYEGIIKFEDWTVNK